MQVAREEGSHLLLVQLEASPSNGEEERSFCNFGVVKITGSRIREMHVIATKLYLLSLLAQTLKRIHRHSGEASSFPPSLLLSSWKDKLVFHVDTKKRPLRFQIRIKIKSKQKTIDL